MHQPHHHHHHHLLPCLHCHPQGYIRMVQHLIERCLLLHMSREECVRALAERANIRPFITLTVWKELQKENRGFFQAYYQGITPTPPICKKTAPQRISKFTTSKRRGGWRRQV